jgi:glycosyltransferase involved in cell wall biosynthesis
VSVTGPTPTVSVVIPCYNGARWLRLAVESALAQDHPALEVIVVDDGSSDDSLAIARAFAPRVRVEARPHAGACAARNHGAAVATGDLVLFLDADDALLPGALRTLCEAIDRSGADAAFGDSRIVDEHGRPLGERVYRNVGPDTLENFMTREGVPITSCALLKRKSSVTWDETLPSAQEFDYFMRRAIAGDRFVHAPSFVLEIREHDSPGRISVKEADDRILVMGRCWLRFEQLLIASGRMTPQRAALVAYGFMGTAIACYMHGHRREAALFGGRVSRRLLLRTKDIDLTNIRVLYLLGGYRLCGWYISARFLAGGLKQRIIKKMGRHPSKRPRTGPAGCISK